MRTLTRRLILLAAMTTPFAAQLDANAQSNPQANTPGGPQGWPAGTIKLVVPYPPGGSTDVIARLVQPCLQQRLGTNLIIENRAGASGSVGTAAVAKSPPDGGLVVQPVLAARLRIDIVDLPVDRARQIELSVDHVGPSRCAGVLEVGHEDVGAAVQRIDDHFAVDRPGDLDAAVEDILRQRRHGPVALADFHCLGQEIGLLPGIQPLLALDPGGQQFLTAQIEAALQVGDEGDCLLGKHFLEVGIDDAVD